MCFRFCFKPNGRLKTPWLWCSKDLGKILIKWAIDFWNRSGRKRSDVMYGISRIFISHRRNLPDALNESFKPYYDIETFKCLMYAFLSAAIKSEKRQEEE